MKSFSILIIIAGKILIYYTDFQQLIIQGWHTYYEWII